MSPEELSLLDAHGYDVDEFIPVHGCSIEYEFIYKADDPLGLGMCYSFDKPEYDPYRDTDKITEDTKNFTSLIDIIGIVALAVAGIVCLTWLRGCMRSYHNRYDDSCVEDTGIIGDSLVEE